MLRDLNFPEWRNSNERRKYPFADTSTLRNASGVTIDQDLFDDARICPIGGNETLYLSGITVTLTTVTILIGTSSNASLASGSFDVLSAPDTIGLEDVYGRPAGVLVSSTLKLQSIFGTYGIGDVTFKPGQTTFAPSVIVPMPQLGVQGFLLDDGTLLTGDVYLIGTDGIVLRVEDGAIRVDVVGDPYAVIKRCQEQDLALPDFCGLKTINGILPDDSGDFKLSIGSNLADDNVLRIEQDHDIIKIRRIGTPGRA